MQEPSLGMTAEMMNGLQSIHCAAGLQTVGFIMWKRFNHGLE
jgi:hypothetical protein